MDTINGDSVYMDKRQEDHFPNRVHLEAVVDEQDEFVGFWIRLWAYLTDVIVIFSINGLLFSPLKFINQGMPIEIGYWTLKGILAVFIYYSYFLLMTKFLKQTLGKMVFGIEVIPYLKAKLGWRDVIFREVIGRIIYNVFWIMKVLYLVVAFTNQKEGLHDMLSDTRVVKVKK